MTILDDRDITDDERAAIADEPRPGVWIEPDRAGAPADGRQLTQLESDGLIASELYQRHLKGTEEWTSVRSVLCGVGGPVQLATLDLAFEQRGSIHSDPLVRLLAFRAWGDRDRTWRKRDTARVLVAPETVDSWRDDHETVEIARRIYGFEGVVEYALGDYTANRAGRQATAKIDADAVNEDRREWLDALLDCFDEIDAKLAAGGEPLPSGPLTYEVTA